ncbi:MAG TPA: hydroxyacid dehydrogenase [Marinilabiliales bacterium]|nr:MAG: hydroxyacid dehydrogenase [Bacteroidetes bacterium GWA2_40_14]OFX65152.1 MAG: hydroxyacid dehydrogenase [Bacteroidetes bacterium GWC2_40_13]OFX74328.1 MAG: hydroxyacid dehydrogenase [Bacteroidetes bacterium GWD2_40_43]OFX90937.1 MAG: hydroxyacid dehydrogenase [Bacteroidetes bacterium GWE2_40_63]OFY21151.1 MAG: hydroxyacid dehydrogenase [Bacteroidetes bacterium GWF2_40_13]OFZ25370.1 MAG: hydroxyacid dehydrogenase [Bacteroidetes bacterium RIFOXYC2_FULL_40_12]HAM98800.1 hydroxyacid dehyd
MQNQSPKIAVFSTKNWVIQAFDEVNKNHSFEPSYFEARLDKKTAPLAAGHEVVCAFVNDKVDAKTLEILKTQGIKLIALRCAGFNNVDIEKAQELDIAVVRVPAYSPYAVAEHTLGLILALNRKLHKAYHRVRDGNFALDGLMGFDLHQKTIGIIGTGKIGQVFCQLIKGFGVRILAYDKYPNEELKNLGIEYVELPKLYQQCDIISLHCPLTYETYHMINEYAIAAMKPGVMIVNTSRGPLIDSNAVIEGLKKGKVGNLALDVYEEEEALFFEDLSEKVIQDDTFVRLQTFPNVLITAHQAFFTKEAVHNIAETTFANIAEFFKTGKSANQVIPVGK